jgi:hypothetical protein
VPDIPSVGVKPVILGVDGAVTVKGPGLGADPAATVTTTGPVVAPTGTLVTIWLAVDETTLAAAPLNVTVFCPAVGPKPVPEIVTVAPTTPLLGVRSMTDTVEDA